MVECYLKESKSRSKNDDSFAGGEVIRLALEGRIDTVAIDGVQQFPAALPAALLPGTVGAIEIDDLGAIAPVKAGEFYLEESVDSAFGLSDALGARIRGYLARRVEWVDAL